MHNPNSSVDELSVTIEWILSGFNEVKIMYKKMYKSQNETRQNDKEKNEQ
jgi:hypothetical protein